MKKSQLGSTDISVSAIGFGASSLGGGVFGPVEEADAIAAVHAALDCGITLFDVSPFYGNTRAENVLGKALRGISRDRFLLSTKAGRYGDDLFDFSPERVRRSIDESLMRLGLDHVDLLHVHDVEYGDLHSIAEQTIPELQRIAIAGKARLIGVTGYPLAALRTLTSSAHVDCVLSYNHCALNDTTLLDLLPEWIEAGIGVISAGALSQGLLAGTVLPSWHPAPPHVRIACANAVDFTRSQGADPAALAIQFASAQPGIASTLIGITNARQVEAAVNAVESPMNDNLLREVLCILKPIHNHTWQTGRAENN
jgi:L-galactose dehydrogenase